MALLHGGHVGGVLEDIVDGDEAGGRGTAAAGLTGLLLVARVGHLWLGVSGVEKGRMV